jgi:hypothetical protein
VISKDNNMNKSQPLLVNKRSEFFSTPIVAENEEHADFDSEIDEETESVVNRNILMLLP